MKSRSQSRKEDYHKEFAQFYDLLSYKKYATEVNCLAINILDGISCSPLRILSVGCGTGIHESILAESEHDVTGIDTSAEMISLAKKKNIAAKKGKRCNFIHQDIRNFEEDGFDVALSLFNVVNCLSGISSLCSFFLGIEKTLNRNGILFFECWNGMVWLVY